MSVTGLGLEWVRRKHPELRPEHPEHRRQRFCRAADAEQLAHAAALRESSLQKREAAACRCRRPGQRDKPSQRPANPCTAHCGRLEQRSHRQALPPLPKRVDPLQTPRTLHAADPGCSSKRSHRRGKAA